MKVNIYGIISNNLLYIYLVYDIPEDDHVGILKLTSKVQSIKKITVPIAYKIFKTFLHVTCDSVVNAEQKINPLLKDMVWNYTIECPNFKTY